MAKQSSRNRRASQSSRVSQSTRASQSHAQELRSLKDSLTDLQSKRLSALRLYQEEKIERQKEAARAEQLLSQLKTLQNSSLTRPRQPDNPTNVVTTDSFKAELRGLGRAPPIPFASLTWHCLAMADILTGPPDVFAVLHPIAAIPAPSTVNDASTVMTTRDEASVKRKHRSMHANGQIPADVNEDIEKLTRRLQQLEAEAESAKRSLHNRECLVSDLKSQLEESTAARQDLLKTVKEQRETIERLS